jgi:mRNA interferase MazF
LSISPNPKRGEIWYVDLNPTKGAEMQKTRRCVVVSSDSMGRLPIKLFVPVTEWDPKYSTYPWMVKLTPSTINCLKKDSAVDTMQVHGYDIVRFQKKIGQVTADELEEIITAIALVIEFV